MTKTLSKSKKTAKALGFVEIMQTLKSQGNPQTAKIYQRHGAGKNVYGVSFANLYKLQKQIQTNHELAMRLWNSGNVDARTLATMIADPTKLTINEAEQWVNDYQFYALTSLVADVVSKSPLALLLMRAWMKSGYEYIKASGYEVLAHCVRNGIEVSDETCRQALKNIEKEIHDSPNRARHSMNAALISIGSHKPILSKEAIETAKRIGKVDVDHGDTSCKTPDAASHIQKAKKKKGTR